MKDIYPRQLYRRLHKKKDHFPYKGLLALTYRCNLNCVHCYSKGVVTQELSTDQWKKIIDELRREGCVYLTFSGGDPFMRDDFLELYSYARQKGFIVTIFTNGHGLTKQYLDYFAGVPPFAFEITLNGITRKTYESITQVKGAFHRVMEVIGEIKKRRLHLIIKANCLRQNKGEIVKIKEFADRYLGGRKGKHFFKYDVFISPRLNGDKTPCKYRLTFNELFKLRKINPEIWSEYRRSLKCRTFSFPRDRTFMYSCDSWQQQFYINPQGMLQFCLFSDKMSIDLMTTPFRQGFYKLFPGLLKIEFKTNSKCKDCRLRAICFYCPARAYLETKDEESPVPYFCEYAKDMAAVINGPNVEAGLPSKSKATCYNETEILSGPG